MQNMERELRRFSDWLARSDRSDLQTASRDDCQDFLTSRRAVSASTSHMAWRALRSFFGFLAEEDGAANPMKHVKMPKVAEPVTRVATEHEYETLQGYLAGEVAKAKGNEIDLFEVRRAQAVLGVLWDCGLRRGELTNLKVNDVDMDTGHAIVRQSKTGRPRVVPFTEATKRLLYGYLRQREWHPQSAFSTSLWLGAKGGLTSDGVRQLLDRVCDGAGVRVSAHMFRRALAERWLSNGGSQVSLMSIAGWTSPAMPARYTRSVAGQVAENEYRRVIGR
jgi:site-specific recombinase XerD